MGNSLDKVDEGLYICGLEGLSDAERLKTLGITHILNAASIQLYSSRTFKDSQGALSDLPNLFVVKALECEDAEDCNLSVHFKDLADFIDVGRQAGGVVVHCAAGISRASTSVLAYLMIKQHLSLDAAFYKLHTVRKVVQPNDGFWRQLVDLEAVLQAQGVCLQPPSEKQKSSSIAAAEKIREGPPDFRDDESDTASLLAQLNRANARVKSFTTHFLTAHVTPEQGITCNDLADSLRATNLPGVSWHSLDPSPDGGDKGFVGVRAQVVPSMDGGAFAAILRSHKGVQIATCESGR